MTDKGFPSIPTARDVVTAAAPPAADTHPENAALTPPQAETAAQTQAAAAPATAPAPRPRNWPLYLEFLVPMLLYLALVIPGVYIRLEQMNYDGVVYIRRAQYIANGDWAHAFSGYWSPLISWCIAPLLLVKVDGLLAARLVLALWGAAWLVAGHFFLRRMAPAPWWVRTLAACALALTATRLTLRSINPDVMLGACLLAYLALSSHPRLLRRRQLAFAAGAAGGLAYLAKSYGLPFFLVHAPCALLFLAIRLRRARRAGDRPAPTRPLRRDILATAASMLAGFCLLAVPWITALSLNYGRLTVSTVGPIAHAIMNQRTIRVPEHMKTPPDPYLLEGEIVDRRPYRYWSPFASRENFLKQLRVIRDNLVGDGKETEGLIAAVTGLDSLWLAAAGVVAACGLLLVRLFTRRRRRDGKGPRLRRGGRRIALVLFTAVLYCGGFLPIYYELRYVLPMLFPLCLVLCLQVFAILRPRARQARQAHPAHPAPQPPRSPAAILLTVLRSPAIPILIILSFGYAAADAAILLLRSPLPPAFRTTAALIKNNGLEGPIASSVHRSGVFVAYHTNFKFVDIDFDRSPNYCAASMRRLGVRSLLVWRNISGSRDPVRDRDSNRLEKEERALLAVTAGNWKLAVRTRISRSQRLEIYVPPDAVITATTRPKRRRARQPAPTTRHARAIDQSGFSNRKKLFKPN